MNQAKKRILFIMSDTGGGHRAAAQAIDEAIHYCYPQTCETFIADIWKDHTPWPINKLPKTYAWLAGPGFLVWKVLWGISTRFTIHKLLLPLAAALTKGKVIRYLKVVRPDLVVSLHPFMNHLGLAWINEAQLEIPFVTIVVDMVTIHPLWICPQVTLCLVPTEPARQMAIKLGMPPQKIVVCGQPIRLQFSMIAADKCALRQKLGLDLKRQTILVMGGGEGIGRVFEITRAIAQTVSQAQLVIISGRNRALKRKLEAVVWEIPTYIYGFVDNMPELMHAADMLITKAGPNTLSEAFAAGLPTLISGYIYGHEFENVTYVCRHQAGAYAEAPEEIARLVSTWLDADQETHQKMSCNAARLAKPDASLVIARQICKLLFGIRDYQE